MLQSDARPIQQKTARTAWSACRNPGFPIRCQTRSGCMGCQGALPAGTGSFQNQQIQEALHLKIPPGSGNPDPVPGSLWLQGFAISFFDDFFKKSSKFRSLTNTRNPSACFNFPLLRVWPSGTVFHPACCSSACLSCICLYIKINTPVSVFCVAAAMLFFFFLYVSCAAAFFLWCWFYAWGIMHTEYGIFSIFWKPGLVYL